MGGFTVFYLKDRSEENVAKHNELLKQFGVAKKYRFYSIADVREEYEYYKKGIGGWPEHSFPKDKIHSFDDFKRYWNPKAVGENFVPYTGSLSFDCYFGRTSRRAMKAMGKYIVEHRRDILAVNGSYETFYERGMTRLERQIMVEDGIMEASCAYTEVYPE